MNNTEHKHPLTALVITIILCAVVAAHAQQSPDAPEADAYFQKQDWANAVKAYQSITARQPSNGRAWFKLGLSLHRLGQYGEAIEAYRKAEEIGHNPLVMYNLACAYSRMSNKDQAFEWLTKAAQKGFDKAQALETDHDLDAVRGDPRFAEVMKKVLANAQPCSASPLARQFDFWVGEWEVKTPQGQLAGTSSVQLMLGNCVVFENWTGSQGGSGKSLNVYNSTRGKWQQMWADDRGTVTEYTNGEFKEGAMRFLTEKREADGSLIMGRLTFFNLGPDGVRQLGEESRDGGKTWTPLFDLIYRKKNLKSSPDLPLRQKE